MDGGSHMEALPSQHLLDRKEKKSVPPENSPEFLIAARFQNNIMEIAIDQRLAALKDEGELTEEEIAVMNPDQRMMRAADEIMAFPANHGAAYKFMIKTNPELFHQVYSFEKDNPGGGLVKSSTEDMLAAHAAKKAKYDSTKKERREVAERLFAELKTEKMRLLNKIMVGLNVSKKIEKGGITLDEYLKFIQPSVEALLVNDKELIMSVMDEPDKAREIFKDHLQDITNSRPKEIAKQGPN
jgi:hypothetical protein